jgi:hypothetical protein
MSKYGLTCDNLVSAEVVTADGQFLTASAEEHDDLFWGLRGGGGNFGIVTSFEFRLHDVPEVYAGGLVYSTDQAPDALRHLRDVDPDMPDELGVMATFRPAPDGAQVFGIEVCFAGPSRNGEAAMVRLRQFGPPTLDTVQRTMYAAHQKSLDCMWPHGLFCYWKSGFFETLSDDVIEIVTRHARAKPSALSVVAIALHHGAVTRISPVATAFNHRKRLYNLNIQAQWRDSRDREKNMAWIQEFWQAIEPFMTGRVYVNFLS